MHIFHKIVVCILFISALTSCFTGVENTRKITEKDVSKLAPIKDYEESGFLSQIKNLKFDSLISGDQFYVTDNQVKLLFLPSDKYDLDSIAFENNVLTYQSQFEDNPLGNKKVVSLVFADRNGNRFVYPTKRSKAELAESILKIPFMIDMSVVNEARNLMKGKEFFIRTNLWYDAEGNLKDGRKFIKVKVTNVEAGNKTFPIKVEFVDDLNTKNYIFLSTDEQPIANRRFDNIFSLKDIRTYYPSINDKHWDLIVNGQIAIDMTKEECRLSLGSPQKIERIPTYGGLKELWLYENGVYMAFEDGILTNFRK